MLAQPVETLRVATDQELMRADANNANFRPTIMPDNAEIDPDIEDLDAELDQLLAQFDIGGQQQQQHQFQQPLPTEDRFEQFSQAFSQLTTSENDLQSDAND